MQIHLKQKEIEAALKLYISRQGIDLAGKAVTIDFTAGRKDSGISADLVIEGAPISFDTPPPQASPPEPEVSTKPVSIFGNGNS